MEMKYGMVSSALLTIALALMSVSPVQAGRHFGKDAPFEVSELPIGKLRAKLESLPPEKRQRAMGWLHRFNFPASDVPQLRADANGAVLYVEEVPATVQAATTPTAGAAAVGATIPTAAAFTLHSKPGAPNVIYLDFDGHTVTGSAWNSTTNPSYSAVAYNIDAIAGFSTAELNNIINIWRRVSEDYAPFNVDVTTQLPATFGARVARVLITSDIDANGKALPYQGAGGVAYIDVFGRSDYQTYQPAFVYFNRLGNGREDYVAEAASHEMGHNLGLSHDGSSTASYYAGHGSGATSWAPIMGVAYNRAISEFSKGEYAGASNLEDDIAIITTKLGGRADDYGNDSNTGAPLILAPGGVVASTTLDTDWTNAQPQNKGVLGSRTDVDVFYFDAAAGSVNLTVAPHRMPVNTAGGNADLQLQLFNQGGASLGISSPNGNTGATLVASIPQAGRVFVHVSGVGDATVPYSDYASMGQYYLSGTVPVGVANTTPPSPNPMAFELAPRAASATTITMRAQTAIDDAGSAVQYRFECMAGGAGCVTSAWQTARDYSATGLAANTTYRFRVRARDAVGNETAPSAEFSVTTPAVANRPPVAVADSATVRRRSSVSIPVLANDSDPDGNPLTITAVSRPLIGSVTVQSGAVTYTSTGIFGTDRFTYTISDGRGGTAIATVTVTVRR